MAKIVLIAAYGIWIVAMLASGVLNMICAYLTDSPGLNVVGACLCGLSAIWAINGIRRAI